jgi:hypothetical protein
MKKCVRGLEGNYLLMPIGKYLLQPKLPSQFSIHSIILIAFHQLPIDYFFLLQLPSNKLLIFI